MAVFAAATLPEVELVLDARESGMNWRACANSAGLPHKPSIYRRWFQRFNRIMSAVLPSVACLEMKPEEVWISQLRKALNVTNASVLITLRMRLFNDNGAVFGPLSIFAHGRVRSRDIRSP
jgi:hypothetical protein